MFDRMKKMYEMKKRTDSMKKEMEAIHLDIEEKGIRVKIRGDQHLEELLVDGKKDDRMRDVVNKAIKETQKKVSKKMQGRMGDFGF